MKVGLGKIGTGGDSDGFGGATTWARVAAERCCRIGAESGAYAITSECEFHAILPSPAAALQQRVFARKRAVDAINARGDHTMNARTDAHSVNMAGVVSRWHSRDRLSALQNLRHAVNRRDGWAGNCAKIRQCH